MLELKQRNAETGSAERNTVPGACQLVARSIMLLFVLSSPCVWGDITPEELIQRWANGQASATSRGVQSITNDSYKKSQTAESRFGRRDAIYYTDGQRLDVATDYFPSWEGDVSQGVLETDRNTRFIFNGDGYFERTRYSKQPSPPAYVGDPDYNREGFESRGMPDAPLWGYFPGNKQPLAGILKSASQVQVRSDVDESTGAQQFVFQAKSPEGEHLIWFDPDHGYNISKVELRKQGEDLLDGRPISAPLSDEEKRFRENHSPQEDMAPEWRKSSFLFTLDKVRSSLVARASICEREFIGRAGKGNFGPYPQNGFFTEGITIMTTTGESWRVFCARSVFILRMVLGFILIWAALDKIRHPYQFLGNVYDYEMLGPRWGLAVAIFLPWLELGLGICLLSRVLVGGAFLCSGALMSVFAYAQIWAIYSNLQISCACFSQSSGVAVNYATLTRTFVLLFLAAVAYFLCLAENRYTRVG